MSEAEKSAIRIVLRFDIAAGDGTLARLGRGKIALLSHIRDTGSISAAGRAMDMSYRRAWLLVDELNAMFDQPAVESQRGGKQGGGASLTDFGIALLDLHRRIEEKTAAAIADELRFLADHRNRERRPEAGNARPEAGHSDG